jgi:transposase
VYTDMENWAEIRRRVLADGLSGRAACREYNIHWKTLKKILSHAEPPGYRRTKPRRPSILDPLLPVVHQILEDDKKAPKKQRHTAKRIFDRLRAEHGYPGGLTIVKEAVRARRLATAEVFVPLAHPPGEAQADFGHAEVILDGQATKVAVFVMTLPYSDAIFACTFPRECTEAFLEGHVRAFEFFGGVPRRISYDNSRIAVARITGPRDRKLTGEFLRLKSHHLFKDHFCLVRRPDEGARRDPGGLRPPQLPRAGARGARRPGAAQRPARGRLPCGPLAEVAGQAVHQGRAARRGTLGDAAAAGRGVPGRPGRAAPGRLALAGPLRHQRLLRADRLRPPRAHRRRDGG